MPGPQTTIGVLVDQQYQGHEKMAQAVADSAAYAKSTQNLIGQTGAVRQQAEALTQALSRQSPVMGGIAAQLGLFSAGAGLAAAGMLGLGVASVSASQMIGAYQEKLDLASEATGFAVREIGGLTVGASNLGKSYADIQPALLLFTRRLGEAQAGSIEAQRSFYELGVPIRDLNGQFRTTGAIAEDVARALDGIGNAADRNRLAGELFGRNFATTIAVLRQGLTELADTAEQKGIVFSESQADMARKADAAWDKMGISIEGLKNRMLLSLTPMGTAIADFTNKAIDDFNNMATAIDRMRGLPNLKFGIMGVGAAVAPPIPVPGQGPAPPPGTMYGYPRLNEEIRAHLELVKAIDAAKRSIETFALPPFHPDIRLPLGGIPFTTTGKDPSGQFREMTVDAEAAAEANRNLLKQSISGFQTLAVDSGHILAESVGSLVGNVVAGVGNMEQAFKNMIVSIVAQTAAAAATRGILSILRLEAGGTLLAMAGGGTIGRMPFIPAQEGLMLSGVRGRDTVPVAMQKGETVISPALTNQLARFLTAASSSRPGSLSKTEHTNLQRQPLNVIVNIQTFAADARSVRRVISRDLAAPLAEIMGSGRYS